MAMMRALIVRHTPYEGVAGFRQPIEQAGYAVSRIDAGDSASEAIDWCEPDLVVLMGGPMGVYEQAAHPWMAGELAGLVRRLAERRPTVGVCLGSQLIAAALGARVYAGPVRELGFAAVALTEQGASSPLRHLADVPVLHWHGDTFDLPAGAERLAETSLYANQAFRIGGTILALQFHPEMGEDQRFAHWLADEDYVRSAGCDPATLAEAYRRQGPAAVAAGRLMLAEWLSGLE